MRSEVCWIPGLGVLALLLGGVPCAQAQGVLAESALTVQLELETVVAPGEGDPVPLQFRVSTKDLIAELVEKLELDVQDRFKLVVRRLTAEPDASDPAFTAGQLLLLGATAEQAIAADDFSIFSELALPELSASAESRRLRKGDGALVGRTRLLVRGLQSGDLAAPPDGNASRLQLAALEQATEQLRRVGGGAEALFFSKRTLAVLGTAAFNTAVPGLPPGLPESAIVTGKLMLASEKAIDL